jgi:acyl transferase domain-containing protein
VSAFGFGGTNFHIVMKEYMPEQPRTDGHRSSAAVPVETSPAEPVKPAATVSGAPVPPRPARASSKPPLRGALVLGAATEPELTNELRTALAEARQGRHLAPAAPSSSAALGATERLAIDYADGSDLETKAETALRALQAGNPAAWPMLRARGIHRGSGAPGKVAFLYTGQGSQYANMLAELRSREAVIEQVFDDDADDHGPAAGGSAAVGHRVCGPRRRGGGWTSR